MMKFPIYGNIIQMFQSTPTSHEPISRPCLLLGGSAFVESFESDCQRRPAKWLKLAGTLRVLPGRSWFKRWRGKKDRAGSNISLIFATIKNTFYLNLGVAGREKRTENMEHRVEGKPEKKNLYFHEPTMETWNWKSSMSNEKLLSSAIK